jgi:hypothetical protein
MRVLRWIGYISLGLTVLGALTDARGGDTTPEDRAAAIAVAADLLGDNPPPATRPAGPKPDSLRQQILALFGKP